MSPLSSPRRRSCSHHPTLLLATRGSRLYLIPTLHPRRVVRRPLAADPQDAEGLVTAAHVIPYPVARTPEGRKDPQLLMHRENCGASIGL